MLETDGQVRTKDQEFGHQFLRNRKYQGHMTPTGQVVRIVTRQERE